MNTTCVDPKVSDGARQEERHALNELLNGAEMLSAIGSCALRFWPRGAKPFYPLLLRSIKAVMSHLYRLVTSEKTAPT